MPASPAPTSAKGKARKRDRDSKFLHGLLPGTPSKVQASQSMTGLDIYADTSSTEASERARKSLTDLPASGQDVDLEPHETPTVKLIAPSTDIDETWDRISRAVQLASQGVGPEATRVSPPSEPILEKSEPALMKPAKLAWHGFKLVAKHISAFLDGTPFKLPVAVLNVIIDTADAVIDNKESMANLLLPIGERLQIFSTSLLSTSSNKARDPLNDNVRSPPDNIDPSLDRFVGVLVTAAAELKGMHSAGLVERILDSDEHSKKVEDIFRRVDEATKNFQLELNLAAFRQINAVKEDTEVLRLNNLRPIQEVEYPTLERKPPVKACVAGTREDIVEGIISWCKDTSDDVSPVYWLSGMAGTGKSTIAYTVCERLAKDDKASRLGATFFCWRQLDAGRKRRNIIPTLAHQLALELPGFRRALLDAKVDAKPPPLETHLDSLIIRPWSDSVKHHLGFPPLVIVVDALDELDDDDENNIGFLDDLIKKLEGSTNRLRGLKFLVTSRRDPRIVRAGEDLPPGAVYHLEDVPTTVIDQDINLYLRAALPRLTGEQIRYLSEKASDLFIYAATAVRFICPPYQHPPPSLKTQNERLEVLLRAWPDQSRRGAEGLLVDRLYEDILARYISPLSDFDKNISISILHTFLCTQKPVPIPEIPRLLSELEIGEEDVMNVLLALHSVLYISSDRVYSYHKSFPDFLADPTRFVDPDLAATCCLNSGSIQIVLLTSCFRLMESLCFNICDLPSSFLQDREVDNLPTRVAARIPYILVYACRYWAAHLGCIPRNDQKVIEQTLVVIDRWLDRKSLFWMEAMHLVEMWERCHAILGYVESWVVLAQEMLKDLRALRDMGSRYSASMMFGCTPHLYISALAAASPDSGLISRWQARFPGIPSVTSHPAATTASELESRLRSVRFLQEGNQILTGTSDGIVRIWEVATATQLVCAFIGHKGTVRSVDFREEGFPILSGSDDHTVRVWDPSTGEELHRLLGHDSAVHSVAFSSDGSRAISGSANGVVLIWNPTNGEQLGRLTGHEEKVNSIVFSASGLYIISGSNDETARIWEVSTGQEVRRLTGNGPVTAVAFSADDSLVTTGSGLVGGTVDVWDFATGKHRHELTGHQTSVSCIAFSQDGMRVMASADSTVRVWQLSTSPPPILLESNGVATQSVAFSPDGLSAISSSSGKTDVRLWEVTTGRQLGRLSLDTLADPDIVKDAVGFSPKGFPRTFLPPIVDGSASANRLVVSPDRSLVVSISDSIMHVWNLSSKKCLRQLIGHHKNINAVAFSLDGTRVISGSDDATLRVWNPLTGQQVYTLRGHDGAVLAVESSTDGLLGISGGADGTARIWDLSTGTQIQLHRTFSGLQEAGVRSVSFSEDGFRAIAASERDIIIWNIQDAAPLHLLKGHSEVVTSARLSPENSRVISGSEDGRVFIWTLSQQGNLRPSATYCFFSQNKP
ncbi:WD40-repeat-containing domain protein [Mycena filopes]|nr:WD40-repeat-containing domain protein [Mycena filopes]